MITYKYKLYRTYRTKYLDEMLEEGRIVWNHALSLQRRYYKLYNKYISISVMKHHFAKRIGRKNLTSQTVQAILERLDAAYIRFFRRLSKRPPKFKTNRNFCSILFKLKVGYQLCGNNFIVNKINRKFKFSLSRPYEGKVKTLTLHRNSAGEFFILIVTDALPNKYGKTHNGASVGIDFGLKTYLTLSDGSKYKNPRFLKLTTNKFRKLSRNLSKARENSRNRQRRLRERSRFLIDIANKRSDFQWKLAHELCKKYDNIFVEDLDVPAMMKRFGRQILDLGHATFIKKLEYVAGKYGVTVHKIERYYPSSKTCTCGYVNKSLTLWDRRWTCPQCGEMHDRDLFAAKNILRRGIYELESGYKTSRRTAKRLPRLHPTIS